MVTSLVLVIDDTPADIAIAVHYLQKLNCNVIVAENGNLGIQKAISILPDLILLDLHLPDIMGFDVCRQLKENELTKDIPIIFLTSSKSSEDVLKGFDCGAVDYITKPYNAAELSARVNTQIRLKQTRDKLVDQHIEIQRQTEIIFRQEKELLEKQNTSILSDLELKNRELTSSLLQQLKFSETIYNLLDCIEQTLAGQHDEVSVRIRSITNSSQLNLEQSNWKEFETRFVNVLSSFNKNLQAAFPDLSKNELRLCAFLSLNMSTKDISSITLQSDDSLRKARYRLRKKLGIDEKENLHSFLSKF